MNARHFAAVAATCALSAAVSNAAPAAPVAPAVPAVPAAQTRWKASSPNPYGRYSYSLEEDDDSFYDTFIKGRIRIGVSCTSASMKKTSAGEGQYFLGNLNNLREEETSGFGLNIRLDLCDYLGVLFANDMHTEVSAWNHGDQSTDGTLEIDGMLLQVIVQYPFRFTDAGFSITPYIGLGYTDISTKWSYAPWWHHGWSSPADYKQYGHGSTEPRNGYSRWMIPEDPSNAFTFSAGVSFEILEHLDIDFFYRQVSVDDVKASFHVYSENGATMRVGAFPAEFSALGLALRYVF